MDEYLFGLNYEDDIEQLYGEGYSYINKARIKLFESLNRDMQKVRVLRNIIQNPMPITLDQFNEWVSIKNKVIKDVEHYLSPHDIATLDAIEKFTYRYHVKEK